MPSEVYFSKLGGIAAIVGVVVLAISTIAHPMSAPPADAAAAFAEYADDRFWLASHLGQLLGTGLIAAALWALAWTLRGGAAGVWAALGAAGALACFSLAGALQAVDGIALKFMVDRWAGASPESQALYFEGAYAVRQVEVGLASMVILFFGLTALLFAMAVWLSERAPAWLGWLAGVSGTAMLGAGLAYAYTGFSDAAMMVVMLATALLIVWSLAVGVFLLRNSRAGLRVPPGLPEAPAPGR